MSPPADGGRRRRLSPAARFGAALAAVGALLATLAFVEKDPPLPVCAALTVDADQAPVHRVEVIVDRSGDAAPLALPAQVSADIAAEAAGPDHVTVIEVGVIQGAAHGDTFWTTTGYRTRPRTQRPDQQAAYGRRVAACVADAVAAARATVPQSDVLGALQNAGRQRSIDDASRTVAVVGNGLANTGALDLRPWMVGDASATQVVAQVRRRGELPELAGTRVRFYGLGEVGGQARVLSSGERTWLVDFWTRLCREAHGVGCTADGQVAVAHAGTEPALPDATFAAPPGVPADRPRHEGPQTVSAGLLFGPDSAALMPEANRVLMPIVRQLAGSSATAVIDGHCATFGPVPGREALSLARADAVRDYLVAHGVDRARLTTRGWGSRKPAVRDTRSNGSLVEAAAQRNRRIVVTVKEGT